MSLKDFSFDRIAQSKGIVLGKVDKAQSAKVPVARVHCNSNRGCIQYMR